MVACSRASYAPVRARVLEEQVGGEEVRPVEEAPHARGRGAQLGVTAGALVLDAQLGEGAPGRVERGLVTAHEVVLREHRLRTHLIQGLGLGLGLGLGSGFGLGLGSGSGLGLGIGLGLG